MNPTSFFLLTLLLVLVTEPASGRPREKFSQTSEDQSGETSELAAGGSGGGSSSTHHEYSRSESSWSSFKPKSPQSSISEEVYEERKYKHTGDSSAGDKSSFSAGELERSYTGRKEKQRFSQEIGVTLFE